MRDIPRDSWGNCGPLRPRTVPYVTLNVVEVQLCCVTTVNIDGVAYLPSEARHRVKAVGYAPPSIHVIYLSYWVACATEWRGRPDAHQSSKRLVHTIYVVSDVSGVNDRHSLCPCKIALARQYPNQILSFRAL